MAHTLLTGQGGGQVSIWIRKKQANRRAAEERKTHAVRRRKPVLEALSLPEDLAENGMRLILVGSRRALIENLLSVIEISDTRIRFMTRSGVVIFSGQGLQLADVRSDAMAVVGEIESVQLPSDRQEGADLRA